MPNALMKQGMVNSPVPHPIIMTTTRMIGSTKMRKKLRSLELQPKRIKQGRLKKEVH